MARGENGSGKGNLVNFRGRGPFSRCGRLILRGRERFWLGLTSKIRGRAGFLGRKSFILRGRGEFGLGLLWGRKENLRIRILKHFVPRI